MQASDLQKVNDLTAERDGWTMRMVTLQNAGTLSVPEAGCTFRPNTKDAACNAQYAALLANMTAFMQGQIDGLNTQIAALLAG